MTPQQTIDSLERENARLRTEQRNVEMQLMISNKEVDTLRKDINELHSMLERYKVLTSQLAKPTEV